MGIGWGILRSFTQFPMETISYWQEHLQSTSSDHPGMAFLAWVADNWLPLAVLIVLVLAIRSYRVLRAVGPTSHHAAFAASALANYLDVNPTTPRLLKLEGDEEVTLTRSFWTILKEGLAGGIFNIMTGIPFLPNEVIPGRNVGVASFKEDFRKYLSEVE